MAKSRLLVFDKNGRFPRILVNAEPSLLKDIPESRIVRNPNMKTLRGIPPHLMILENGIVRKATKIEQQDIESSIKVAQRIESSVEAPQVVVTKEKEIVPVPVYLRNEAWKKEVRNTRIIGAISLISGMLMVAFKDELILQAKEIIAFLSNL